MIRKTLIRSILQLVLLVSAAVALAETNVLAVDYWCVARASACASQCGTTVNSQVVGTHNEACCSLEWSEAQQGFVCVSNNECPVYYHQYGSGVENFECDEGSQYSWCQCAY